MLKDIKDTDVKINRILFEKAVDLYLDTLNFVFNPTNSENYLNKENICKIEDYIPESADQAWYLDAVLKKMMKAVLALDVIPYQVSQGENKVGKINEIIFPSTKRNRINGHEDMNKEEVKKLLELIENLYCRSKKVIYNNEIDLVIGWSKILSGQNWLSVIQENSPNFKLYQTEDIINEIHQSQELTQSQGLSKLQESFQFPSENEAISFLNDLYRYLNDANIIHSEVRKNIIEGPRPVQLFLTQNKNFKKSSDLYYENTINENIKLILKIFGYDIKAELLHQEIRDAAHYFIQKERRQEDIISQIFQQAFDPQGFKSTNENASYQIKNLAQPFILQDGRLLQLSLCLIQFESPELSDGRTITFMNVVCQVKTLFTQLRELNYQMQLNQVPFRLQTVDASLSNLSFQNVFKKAQLRVLFEIQTLIKNLSPGTFTNFVTNQLNVAENLDPKIWLTNFYKYFLANTEIIERFKLDLSSVLLNQKDNFNTLKDGQKYVELLRDIISSDVVLLDNKKKENIKTLKQVLNTFRKRQKSLQQDFQNQHSQLEDIETYLIHQDYTVIFQDYLNSSQQEYTLRSLCKHIDSSLQVICSNLYFPKFKNKPEDRKQIQVSKMIKELDKFAFEGIDETSLGQLENSDLEFRTQTQGDRFFKFYIFTFYYGRQVFLIKSRSKRELEMASIVANGNFSLFYTRYMVNYLREQEQKSYSKSTDNIINRGGGGAGGCCRVDYKKEANGQYKKEGLLNNILTSSVICSDPNSSHSIESRKEVCKPVQIEANMPCLPRFEADEIAVLLNETTIIWFTKGSDKRIVLGHEEVKSGLFSACIENREEAKARIKRELGV